MGLLRENEVYQREWGFLERMKFIRENEVYQRE